MRGNNQQEEDFLNLLSRHEVSIYRVCRKVAGNDDNLLNDLFNEALLRLWELYSGRRSNNFRGECSEKTWVLNIVYRTALNFRKKYAMPNPFVSIDADLAEQLADTDAPLLGDSSSDATDFWTSLSCLDASDRNILRHFLQGRSYRQIGSAVSMSESAVGTRMLRIFVKLKKYFHQS